MDQVHQKQDALSIAPLSDILSDINIIHQFTAKFGLRYLLFANGTLFRNSGENDKKSYRMSVNRSFEGDIILH
jgi:hypothetical protein